MFFKTQIWIIIFIIEFKKRICVLKHGFVFQNTNRLRWKTQILNSKHEFQKTNLNWIYIRLRKTNLCFQNANPRFKTQICYYIKRICVLYQNTNLLFEICVILNQICVFKFVFCPNLCFEINEIQKDKSQSRNTNSLFYKTQIRVSKDKFTFQKSNPMYFIEICLLWNLCFDHSKFPLVMWEGTCPRAKLFRPNLILIKPTSSN